MELILASKSPRRREILADMGVRFHVITEDVDESCPETSPERFVELIAAKKCAAVGDGVLIAHGFDPAGCIVLAADTVVETAGEILGKPHSEQEARSMLQKLSGKEHRVISGFSLRGPDRTGRVVSASSHTVTTVSFCEISREDLDAYVRSREPYDKAGAYAIQGHGIYWVKGICGDFYNVVGLPFYDIARTLEKIYGIGFPGFGA